MTQIFKDKLDTGELTEKQVKKIVDKKKPKLYCIYCKKQLKQEITTDKVFACKHCGKLLIIDSKKKYKPYISIDKEIKSDVTISSDVMRVPMSRDITSPERIKPNVVFRPKGNEWLNRL